MIQPKVSNGALFRRGLIGRCPACGQGKLFRLWFSMTQQCPRCKLVFERIEGHWIGALGLNTIVSFGILLIVLCGGLIFTAPEFPLVPLLLSTSATAIVIPLLFFPVSRTLWTAIDIAMRPLEPDEIEWAETETTKRN